MGKTFPKPAKSRLTNQIIDYDLDEFEVTETDVGESTKK